MKLNCPECNAVVPSENINIQKMIAVCPDCGAVFSFDTPEPDTTPQVKAKRRKAYQPSAMTVEETDAHMEMAFRTNFRLSQDGPFIASSMLTLGFSFILVPLLSSGRTPFFILAGFAAVALFALYWTVSVVYNKTYITMTDDKITVSRKPLPTLDQAIEVSLSGVTEFRFEETAISKKESYDLPRYNVWAETVDGRRRMIVKDVIEDYAVYIAQRLNESLASEIDAEIEVDTDVNVSRLLDEARGHEIDEDEALHRMNHASADRRR